MHDITRFARRGLLASIIVFGLTGCRTYGGYGTEEETAAAIAEANEQFERSLARARTDLSGLEAAAAFNDALVPVVTAFRLAVEEHAAAAMRHRELAADLRTGFGSYRGLSVVLRSIVTDQHRMRNRYRHLIARGAGARERQVDPGKYQQVPPYFLRMQASAAAPDLGDLVPRGS